MPFFFCFSIFRGGARPLGPPPPGHAPENYIQNLLVCLVKIWLISSNGETSFKDHNGNKYLLLSCAILGILIYVTSLSVIHVFILLNKVKSNQNQIKYKNIRQNLGKIDNTAVHRIC